MSVAVADPGFGFPQSKPPRRSADVVASVLVGRRNRFRWALGFVLSVTAHVAMFGGAWLYARFTPARTIPPQPIMASLVRLGTPRDPSLLPRLPSETHPAASRNAHPTTAPPEPSKTAMPMPSNSPSPSPDQDTVADEEARRRALEALQRQEKLAEALAKLGPETDGPTSPKGEAPEGQLDGDPDGNAAKAAAGDAYAAKVQAVLKRNFIVPTTITDRERLMLSCDLRIFIAADGTITHYKLERPSGNDIYDRAVEASLDRTGHLPAPPDVLASGYASGGLGVRFKP